MPRRTASNPRPIVAAPLGPAGFTVISLRTLVHAIPDLLIGAGSHREGRTGVG